MENTQTQDKKSLPYKLFHPLYVSAKKTSNVVNNATSSVNQKRAKVFGGISRRSIIIFLSIFAGICIVAFLVMWLGFKQTSPQQVFNFFGNLDFDIYAGLALLLLGFLVIKNIVQIIFAFYENKFNKKRFFISNLIVLLLVFGIFLVSYVFRHPNLQKNYPEYGQSLKDYSKPLEVVFNLPVVVGDLKPTIVPQLEGEWVWEPYLGIKNLSRVGHFYPKITAFPQERFILYITGVSKFTDRASNEYGYVFESPALPTIVSSIPEADSENVSRNDEIVLQIDKKSGDMVDWTFTTNPLIEFKTEFAENNQIKIIPSSILEQGIKYTLNSSYKPKRVNLETGEMIEVSDSINLPDISFTTAKEPLVNSFSPIGNAVNPNSPIKIEFSEEMDKDSVEEHFVIEPEVEGDFVWETDLILAFTPEEDLPKDTSYKVKLTSGTKSKNNGEVASDAEFDFETAGQITVLATTPNMGANGVSELVDIKIHFDQEIDKESFAGKFSINPALPGQVIWDGNIMTYDANVPLTYNTEYSVPLLPGLKAVYGYDLDFVYEFKFRVKANLTVFSIPQFYQPQGSFSCNIYTAMMVLAWKGYSSDATGLIAEIGYDAGRSGNSWTGNPYARYVGTYDGSWGYGVYYPPIQTIFANRGIYSEAKVGWNVNELAAQVHLGRPVVIWRYNGVSSGANISWTASDGTYVPAFSGMHGGVISGVQGPADNPTSFYINDPWFGQFWMDVGTFDYYWSFTNRMAVIVF